jgi:hypothetical protein
MCLHAAIMLMLIVNMRGMCSLFEVDLWCVYRVHGLGPSLATSLKFTEHYNEPRHSYKLVEIESRLFGCGTFACIRARRVFTVAAELCSKGS